MTAHTPQLLECNGVGPDTAATLLITAGDNPQRLGSELASPRCAASARSRRPLARRNAAAATAAVTGKPTPRCIASRCPACAGTIAPDYLDRRIAEGKTPREAIRCLKRTVARQLYQLITKPQPTPITDPSAA